MSFADKVGGNRTRQKETPFPTVATPQTSPVEANNEAVGATPQLDVNKYFKKDQSPKKKQVSIYLRPDTIDALNAFGEVNGKGAKSDLIDNLLRDLFKLDQ